MTAAEAKEIAKRFVATQELRGYVATCVEARKHARWPNEWNVIFELRSSEGHLMDGPMIVIVNETTNEARLFESP